MIRRKEEYGIYRAMEHQIGILGYCKTAGNLGEFHNFRCIHKNFLSEHVLNFCESAERSTHFLQLLFSSSMMYGQKTHRYINWSLKDLLNFLICNQIYDNKTRSWSCEVSLLQLRVLSGWLKSSESIENSKNHGGSFL